MDDNRSREPQATAADLRGVLTEVVSQRESDPDNGLFHGGAMCQAAAVHMRHYQLTVSPLPIVDAVVTLA
jgi:hypothetical protein